MGTSSSGHLEKILDKTTAERAYRQLREDIVSCVLEPGQKLKIEMLKDRYGLGAGPLREALARLSGDHLVDLLGQRGFIVAALSAREALEIGHLRQLLEAEALVQSLTNGRGEWERNLEYAYDRLSHLELAGEESLDELAEWERRNGAFHAALVAACSSEWLLRMRAMLYRQHTRYRLFARLKTAAVLDIHAEHQDLFETAISRDTDRIVEVIRDHVMRSSEAVAHAVAAHTQ